MDRLFFAMQRNLDYGESEIFQLKNPNRNSIVLSDHLLKWGMQDSGLEMFESEKFRICIWKSWSWIWSMDRDREPKVRKADFTKWTAIGQFVDFNTPYLPILTQTTINSWWLSLMAYFQFMTFLRLKIGFCRKRSCSLPEITQSHNSNVTNQSNGLGIYKEAYN